MRGRGFVSLLAFPVYAASVSGVATNSFTGAPVARVHVTLHGRGRYGTTTGADGTFSFEGLPGAVYSVNVERVGFVAHPPQLTLANDENKTNLTISLVPTGAISGRVTNAEGEPVENASVSVNGGDSATTDENGEYRLGGLRPGKYRVRAAKESVWAGRPEIRTDGTVEFHDAATTFPGRVEVQPGADVGGIDIRLARAPFVRVSGRVTGFPRKAENASVMVSQGQSGDGVELHRDGSFEMWRLDPGDYRIEAEWIASSGDQVHTNGVEIHVAGSNIDKIELHEVPDSNLSGRVEFEDDALKEMVHKASPKPLIGLTMLGAAGEMNQGQLKEGDGFHLEKLHAGRYWAGFSDDRMYVKSMRLGTQVIDGAVLDLNEGSHGADLSIVLAAATGSVSGTATGKTVILASAQAEKDTGFDPRFVKVAADGSYRIENLPPGSYRIAAFDDDEGTLRQWGVDELGSVMEPVSVSAGEQVARDLKAR